MGLADRHYMREQSGWRMNTPVWLIILLANIVAFFAEFSNGTTSASRFIEYGALSLDGLKHGYIWQLLTFQFLHASLAHLVFNSVVLYSFARPLESTLGKRAFATLYFLSGFAGGIAQILLGLVATRFSGSVVGASAGICGLVAAFALLYPTSTIYFFFIIPMKAIVFLPITIVLTLIFLVVPSSSPVAHGAHLGGILGGIAWVKLGWYRDYVRMPWERLFDRWSGWHPFRNRQRKRDLVKAASIRTPRWPRSKAEGAADLPSDEFISREVDPILDKISAHGIQSLTERERRILEAARNKMAKR